MGRVSRNYCCGEFDVESGCVAPRMGRVSRNMANGSGDPEVVGRASQEACE